MRGGRVLTLTSDVTPKRFTSPSRCLLPTAAFFCVSETKSFCCCNIMATRLFACGGLGKGDATRSTQHARTLKPVHRQVRSVPHAAYVVSSLPRRRHFYRRRSCLLMPLPPVPIYGNLRQWSACCRTRERWPRPC